MWALEWGITGAIMTYLPLYFAENGLSIEQMGQLMAVAAIGLWVAPFVVGQVCDRWMNSEKYLALAHFAGGLTLIAIPIVTEIYRQTGRNFSGLLALVGLYAVAYFPTIPLASSLTFRHLPDPNRQFGRIRIWGTVGWVASGMTLSLWLGHADVRRWVASKFPACQDRLNHLAELLTILGQPTSSDCFRIAAILSFALGCFCVFLPHTPPANVAKMSIAPLQTMRMFLDRQFTMLIGVSFLLALAVPFYSIAVPILLERWGYAAAWVPAVMTVGQISEFPALLLLSLFLRRYGLKVIFSLGMAAWLVRYALFAFEQPGGLILFGIALHGICHVFLIITIQLYVDDQCASENRVSAQNLFAFITMGIAMPVGFLIAGKLGQWCQLNTGRDANFQQFFAIPALFILILMLIFWLLFCPKTEKPASVDAVDTESDDGQSDLNDQSSR